jgi:stringent starvation protein B
LQLGLHDIMFDARFGGVPRNIVVPCPAVLAIYAKENGAGTVFTVEENIDSGDIEEKSVTDENEKKPKKGKPTLTVVK